MVETRNVVSDLSPNHQYLVGKDEAWHSIGLNQAGLDELCSDAGLSSPSILYYGTTALHGNALNQQSLQALWQTKPALAFYDVNLRLDLFSPEVVREGLRHASVVKVNEEEWERILEWELTGTSAYEAARRRQAQQQALKADAAG